MSKEKGRWNPAEQKPRVWRIVVERLWTLTLTNILLLLDMKKTSESTNYASRKDWNGMSRRNFLPVLRPQNVQWEIGVPRLEQHQQHIANAHLALKTSRHMFTSGWWFQFLWKILVNGTDYLIYYGNKTCLKPPTRHGSKLENNMAAPNPGPQDPQCKHVTDPATSLAAKQPQPSKAMQNAASHGTEIKSWWMKQQNTCVIVSVRF